MITKVFGKFASKVSPEDIDKAIRNRDSKKLSKLLSREDVDINCDLGASLTPLMTACIASDVEIIKLLLDKGADIHAKNMMGNTALALTAAKRAGAYGVSICQLLVEYGADINSYNNNAKKPVDIAKESQNGFVERFIADCHQREDKGLTHRGTIRDVRVTPPPVIK